MKRWELTARLALFGLFFNGMAQASPSSSPPEITSTAPTAAQIGQLYTYQVDAFDPEAGPLSYELNVLPTGMAISPAGLVSWTPTIAGAGEQTFKVTVRDQAGLEVSQYVDLLVEDPSNNAPVINQEPVTNFNIGTTYTYDLQASDADGDTLSYSVWSWPEITGLAISSQGVLTWSPSNRDEAGEYWITVEANDGRLGVARREFGLSAIDLTNHAPIIGAAPAAQTNIGVPYTHDLQVTDADGDSLTYELSTWPQNIGMTLSDNGVINWTPTRDNVGENWVSIKVNDGHLGQAEISYELNVVDPNNHNPVITSTPITQATQGIEYVYAISVTDADSDAVTLSLFEAPVGMALNTSSNTITWTPAQALAEGVGIKIDARDNYGGFVRQEYTLIVNEGSNTNSAPIANDQSVIAIEDTALAITLLASDPEGQALSYSILSQPLYGSLSGTNAELSYTPQANFSGTDSFTFSASDGALSSNTATVSISITPVNDAPVANNVTAQTNENTAIDITLTGSDLDGDALTYSIVTQAQSGSVTLQNNVATYSPNNNHSGTDTFTFTASDGVLSSNAATVSITVTPSSNNPPQITSTAITTGNEGASYSYAVIATDADTSDVLSYALTAAPTGMVIDAQTGVITWASAVAGSYSVAVEVSDGRGGSNTQSYTLTIANDNTDPGIELPVDPSTVAPPLSANQLTSLQAATEFLYTGTNPIQTGVAPSTIDAMRAAVVRGRVLSRDNTPLSGVSITIKDRPELGQTITRADGFFDMAVNGGGTLVVDYQRDGYLPLQRKVNVPWRTYASPDDVVMIPLDAQVTTITPNSNSIQVARGQVETDASGNRQATLLFPAGTQATMTLPNGSTQPLSTLNVRATEYTVGNQREGLAAMPGLLPPTSAYTYAVELSVDEAIAAGATRVDFNQPIPFYVENFIGFPVGSVVPLGWYDREKSAWVPADDGRVIAILGVQNGLAQLDIDGSGNPADAAALTVLGVTDAERAQLAQLYAVGATLWRAPVTHFTPFDCNWPFDFPFDAIPPLEQLLEFLEALAGENRSNCPGCTINPQEQILGEHIPVIGSPHTLHYSSERVEGRKVNRVLDIQLSGDTLPASLIAIDLTVEVAGQVFRQSFDPTPNQTFSYEWDGQDVYGRQIMGSQPADITISYRYNAVYVSTIANPRIRRSFAIFNQNPDTGIAIDTERLEISSTRSWRQTVGFMAAQNAGIGGWSIADHHWYDIGANQLYLGSGETYNATQLRTITTLINDVNDSAYAAFVGDITYAPNGDLYALVGPDENTVEQIIRFDPQGQVTEFAGFDCLDPLPNRTGPATQACFRDLSDIEVRDDGVVFVADTGNNLVRRIDSNGVISTVAGSGAPVPALYFPFELSEQQQQEYEQLGIEYTTYDDIGGEGGLATEAFLYGPMDIAIASNGDVYIADTINRRIRRVSADERIVTYAGNGYTPAASPTGINEGGLATDAALAGSLTLSVAVDANDSLLIGSDRIRRVNSDGTIYTIAGGGTIPILNADGVLALNVGTVPTVSMAVDDNGRIYTTGDGQVYPSGQIYQIVENGLFQRIAGRLVSEEERAAILDGMNGADPFTSEEYLALVDAHTAQVALLASISEQLRSETLSDEERITLLNQSAEVSQQLDVLSNRLEAYQNYNSVNSLEEFVIANNADGRVAKDVISNIFGSNFSGVTLNPIGEAVFVDQALAEDDSQPGLFAEVFKVRKLVSSAPDFGTENIAIPSRSGSALYIFAPNGQHQQTVDAITGQALLTFAYDSEGWLSTITDIDGDVTTVQRTGSTPTAIVSADGQSTGLSLDANGYLSGVTNPAGEAYTMEYTEDGLMQRYTDRRQNSTIFEYDTAGRLRRDIDPAGGGWILDRTREGARTTVTMTSGEGRAAQYSVEYREDGSRVQAEVAPDGTETQTVFTDDGVELTTTPDGVNILLQRGADPRFGLMAPVSEQLRITTPSGLAGTIQTRRSAVLDDSANLLSHSELTYTTSYNGREFTSRYDRATNTWLSTSPEGRTTTNILDANGRTILSQTPGYADITYGYDNRGRIRTVTEGSGSTARTTTYTYDSDGFLETITDPLDQVTRAVRDDNGRPLTQILDDQRQVAFEYDDNDNVVGITPPERNQFRYDYSPVEDLVTRAISPNDVGTSVTTYSHNLDKQITRTETPEGDEYLINYNAAGRLDNIAGPDGTVGYTYDPVSGKTATVTAPAATVSYSYDGMLQTAESWSGTVSGSVSRSYNNDFYITQQQVNGGFAANYDYDLDGLLTQAGPVIITRDPLNGRITNTNAGSISTTYGYNAFGELESHTTTANGSTLYSVTYTRDALGRVDTKTETIGGSTQTLDYDYDETGRLAGVSGGSQSETYGYDGNDNRLTLTPLGGTVINATIDSQDKLSQYGDRTYTYDLNGALASQSQGTANTRYRYDILGNLHEVTLPDNTLITYQIDGNDRRIGKSRNGVLEQGFLYDGQYNPVAELDGSGNVVNRFIYGPWDHVPVAMIRGSDRYRIISDHIGSVRLVVNESTGAVAQQLDYDAWGKVTNDTNPGFQPFGFAGGLYDRDTQLVRFGFRDYDPHSARWTQPDTIGHAGGDTNLYAYSYSDPVNNIDPGGQLVATLVGCGLGGGIELGLQLLSGRSLGCLSWTSIGLSAAAGCVGGGIFEKLSRLSRFSTRGGLQANKAAGDAARDAIAARTGGVIEQNFRVTGGLRRVDVLNGRTAIESKVGRTGLTKRVRQELARDVKLLRSGQVDRVQWEFSRSAVTGKSGPTGPLRRKLEKFGIEIVE